MRGRSVRGLVCTTLALNLVGGAASAEAAGATPTGTADHAATTSGTSGSAAKPWDLTRPKLSPEQLAAFRSTQGYRGQADRAKDETWLRSVRQRLGTGEFANRASLTGANTPTSGPGYSYIGWLVQRRQATSSACGKATVVEMSATVPGPSAYDLSQSTVASYMGRTTLDGVPGETTSSATNTPEELAALGHFVGEPNFGRSFYEMAWLSDPPSSTQKSSFITRLKGDIANYVTPVVTGVIEVKDGPRLVGHPNLSRIEHWVVAGGWNDNNATLLYADSWTDYGYPIPTKSWISRSTFLYAAGGWGYAW